MLPCSSPDKADKKAEHEKTERQMLVQQERNEEMRELAIKLRKRWVTFVFWFDIFCMTNYDWNLSDWNNNY